MLHKKSIIGAHITISKGFIHTAHIAKEIHANALQIFTKSNRQWRAKDITEEQARSFRSAMQDANIPLQHTVAHASYLINLGSQSKETQQRSLQALIQEIKRCGKLGIPFLVLHPGTKSSKNIDEACNHTGSMLKQAIEQAQEKKVLVLLENMAGQGNSLGSTLEELAQIAQATHNQVGFCIDTCHALAAGYNLANKKEYTRFWNTVENTIKIKNVKIIHVNDSKHPCGSKKDRHEHISQGYIGELGFKLLMQDEALSNIPKILETPKNDPFLEDTANIKLLQSYTKK